MSLLIVGTQPPQSLGKLAPNSFTNRTAAPSVARSTPSGPSEDISPPTLDPSIVPSLPADVIASLTDSAANQSVDRQTSEASADSTDGLLARLARGSLAPSAISAMPSGFSSLLSDLDRAGKSGAQNSPLTLPPLGATPMGAAASREVSGLQAIAAAAATTPETAARAVTAERGDFGPGKADEPSKGGNNFQHIQKVLAAYSVYEATSGSAARPSAEQEGGG